MKRDNGNKNNKKIDFERMLDEEKEKGHRERLRQRFLSTGAKGFTDCEILELLLTYTVTRKNCRGIAGELLRKYRDLYTILKQPGEELQKNKYMTERAAVFFKLLFEIIENELYKKVYNERIVLSSNLKLLNYLKFSLLSRDIEVFKVLFLNTQNELLKEEELFFGTIDRSTVYIRELVKKILEYNAKGVILVHNHPSGSLKPSESDILLTRKVKEVLENIEIRLLDHLIISERGHFSFFGRWDFMKIINIKFRKTKKVYPFMISDSEDYKKGDYVLVDTIRGEQIGIVLGVALNRQNADQDDLKIREVKRKLTEEEVKKLADLDKKADEAYFKCKKIVKRLLPEMNLVIGEYTFDEGKLIFYFTANNRLDFRELVKEVNKTFKKRVEFYQIKTNDEGRILSAFGKYGREIYW